MKRISFNSMNAKAMVSLGEVNADQKTELEVFCKAAAYGCTITDVRSVYVFGEARSALSRPEGWLVTSSHADFMMSLVEAQHEEIKGQDLFLDRYAARKPSDAPYVVGESGVEVEVVVGDFEKTAFALWAEVELMDKFLAIAVTLSLKGSGFHFQLSLANGRPHCHVARRQRAYEEWSWTFGRRKDKGFDTSTEFVLPESQQALVI